jgi:hypothetical protein
LHFKLYFQNQKLDIAYQGKKLGLSQQTQEMQLWGQHGESFDEAAVLNKSKHEIVVAVFAGFATGSFKG